ncbi:MAG: HAD family hydrolase [Gemmatales bacterium]|nr:HAD family hydrolase [Gemmatales bacterium]MCS7159195.1 HAD family hydrolase [Gemmatales bacterium]MDW8174395.1 HAD family hydrolase [Gemmatales bacterium]MDW8223807.1 HAD family hydrolase [Gemmatales bacterium]
MPGRCALFLDRDGVLIEEAPYISSPNQVRLLSGAAEAVARVNRLGVPVIVITNQSGIARGLFTEADLVAVHRRLDELLAREGAHIDRYYYCPHHPAAARTEYRRACACRKPAPGLLHQAAHEMSVELEHSFFIGDRMSDIQAATAAGCSAILVRTGHGQRWQHAWQTIPLRLALIAENLTQAVEYCLPYFVHHHSQAQAA